MHAPRTVTQVPGEGKAIRPWNTKAMLEQAGVSFEEPQAPERVHSGR
jgi:hypothetical protein